MNRFDFRQKVLEADVINKIDFIQEKCNGKDVLDLGCIRHNAIFAENDNNWLHKKIIEVALSVTGVDYLMEEVLKLNKMGFENIIYGDVTKDLAIDKEFDIIIAGDLIEHINNFEGFFMNLNKFLKPGGSVIITTPNPFYIDQFRYIFKKKTILVNPEHTCWIDPLCLDQLVSRFNFQISNIKFIEHSWKYRDLVLDNPNYYYDILNGSWVGKISRFKRKILKPIYRALGSFSLIKLFPIGKLVRYSDYIAVIERA